MIYTELSEEIVKRWVVGGEYMAPSKLLGDYLCEPTLWSDWGLKDHADLQNQFRGSTKKWNDFWDRNLAREIVHSSCVLPALIRDEEDLYHAAMGMISQMNIADITYFLKYKYYDRPTNVTLRQRRFEDTVPYGLAQWVMSTHSLGIAERAVRRAKFGF